MLCHSLGDMCAGRRGESRALSSPPAVGAGDSRAPGGRLCGGRSWVLRRGARRRRAAERKQIWQRRQSQVQMWQRRAQWLVQIRQARVVPAASTFVERTRKKRDSAIPPAPLRTERHKCRSGTWSNGEEAHDVNAEEAHDIAFPIQRFEAERRATA